MYKGDKTPAIALLANMKWGSVMHQRLKRMEG